MRDGPEDIVRPGGWSEHRRHSTNRISNVSGQPAIGGEPIRWVEFFRAQKNLSGAFLEVASSGSATPDSLQTGNRRHTQRRKSCRDSIAVSGRTR